MAGNPYHGNIVGLTGNLLHGWVWHPDVSDERVVLEFFLEGKSLGISIANVYNHALFLDGVGDGVHEFQFRIPSHLIYASGAIRARIANTAHWLDSCYQLEEDEQSDKIQAEITTNGGLRFSGWAVELASRDEPLRLRLTTEKGESWKLVADRFDRNAPESNPYCGFTFTLPLSYADGKLHSLSIETLNGEPVGQSPYPVVCSPEEGKQHSSLDFSHYPQWFEQYGAPRHKLREKKVKFGLRWVGEGDKERTKKSIEEQIHANYSWREYGDYVALLGAGDTLPSWALAAVAEAVTRGTGILYTDCDQDGKDGKRTRPWFKPSWDPELFCQQNYLAPLCVIDAKIYRKFSRKPTSEIPYLAAQYCMEHGKAVRHLPLVCYHRRAKSRNWDDKAGLSQYQEFRQWKRPLEATPLVTIVIPTRDQQPLLMQCIESIRRSSYTNVEILIVDNQSKDPNAVSYLRDLDGSGGVRVIAYDAPFNYSAISNLAATEAEGDVLCFLNNDVEAITPGWIEEMLSLLLRDGVGVVGAKLLWPNLMVQHGGILLGKNNSAWYYGNQSRDEDGGYYYQNQVVRQVSAVTGACLMIRAKDYKSVKGMDECQFPVNYNDVDLCLKVAQKLKKKTLWTPHARLFHEESATRGRKVRTEPEHFALERDKRALRTAWGNTLHNDMAYNPNLSLDEVVSAHSGLAVPPRTRRAR